MSLNKRTTIDHLISVNLEPTQDLTEGQFRTQRLDLADLRGERETVRMARKDRPLTGVILRAVVAVVRQQVRNVDRKPIDHSEAPVAEHRHTVARQIRLTEFRLLNHSASPSRHHNPPTDFRNILLVQDLTHTHQNVKKFDLTGASVAADNGERRALDAQVQRTCDHARGSALIGRSHLADDAGQYIRVNGNLQLLGRVIRPHAQDIQIALNFHDVIEDHGKVLAVPDVELHGAASRAIEPKQAVGVVVVDGDSRLRADLDTYNLRR